MKNLVKKIWWQLRIKACSIKQAIFHKKNLEKGVVQKKLAPVIPLPKQYTLPNSSKPSKPKTSATKTKTSKTKKAASKKKESK